MASFPCPQWSRLRLFQCGWCRHVPYIQHPRPVWNTIRCYHHCYYPYAVVVWLLIRHDACRSLHGQLSWYPIVLVKSLQLLWASGTRRWNLQVFDLQLICNDVTLELGITLLLHVIGVRATRLLVSTEWNTCPIHFHHVTLDAGANLLICIRIWLSMGVFLWGGMADTAVVTNVKWMVYCYKIAFYHSGASDGSRLSILGWYYVFVRTHLRQPVLDWSWHLTDPPLDTVATISQMIFLNALSWMKSFVFWLKFHWGLFLGVQLTLTQYWFRLWLSAK